MGFINPHIRVKICIVRIEHLSLTNFRNYARLELDLPPRTVLLYGANAQGKTSLLEAIYYLATSRSPHTSVDRQLINWLAEQEPLPFARLVADVVTRQGNRRIEITLIKEALTGVETRFRKQVRVNGVPRRTIDLLGQLNVVLFLPQDVALVAGPPGERRRYLDITLCQVDPTYCRTLSLYNRVVTQRNALLKALQERRGSTDELSFWDQQLIEAGGLLMARRSQAIAELEREARNIHRDLSGGHEHLTFRYEPSVVPTRASMRPSLKPDVPLVASADEFRTALRQQMEQGRREEILRGMTLWGPHRDEFRFLVNGVDLGIYGSRGQQRTAVLALKLGEVAWIHHAAGEWPVLLLDEVLAELDLARRGYLLERVDSVQQALLTSTDPSLFSPAFLQKAKIFRVEAGRIIE